jgi:hypothetical protein
MVMKEGEKFGAFVQRINTAATIINSMEGAEIHVTPNMKLLTLLKGVREHHNKTFKHVLATLEQNKNITYLEAITVMAVPARRKVLKETADLAKKARVVEQARVANAAVVEQARVAAVAGGNATMGNKKSECYVYKDYGTCFRGAACKFDHSGVPGTKKCMKCQGKHPAKYCTSATTSRANKVKAETEKEMEERITKTIEAKHAKANKASDTEAKAAKACETNKRSYFDESSDDDDYYSDEDTRRRKPEKCNVATVVGTPGATPPIGTGQCQVPSVSAVNAVAATVFPLHLMSRWLLCRSFPLSTLTLPLWLKNRLAGRRVMFGVLSWLLVL